MKALIERLQKRADWRAKVRPAPWETRNDERGAEMALALGLCPREMGPQIALMLDEARRDGYEEGHATGFDLALTEAAVAVKRALRGAKTNAIEAIRAIGRDADDSDEDTEEDRRIDAQMMRDKARREEWP